MLPIQIKLTHIDAVLGARLPLAINRCGTKHIDATHAMRNNAFNPHIQGARSIILPRG